MKTLKQIVESFEKKILVRYRFDRSAIKRKTDCKRCEYFEKGHCMFLNDKVNEKYTCDHFKRKKEDA